MDPKTTLYLLVLSLLLVAGCRSNRSLIKEKAQYPKNTDSQVIAMLEQKDGQFHTMKVSRADVDISLNGTKNKTRGKIAVYRDSLIVVSIIPALGFEALRVLCTADSVIVINRLNKSYTATSFDFYKRKYKLPVEFSGLQSILSNEVFYYKQGHKDRVFEKNLSSGEKTSIYNVDAFREGRRVSNQGIVINRETARLERISIMDYDTQMKLSLDYGNFMEEDVTFPKTINLNIFEKSNEILLNIEYGQVVFDDSINIKFSVPDHYTREDL